MLFGADGYAGVSRGVLVDHYDREALPAVKDRIGGKIQTGRLVVNSYALPSLNLCKREHAVVFRPRRIHFVFVIADRRVPTDKPELVHTGLHIHASGASRRQDEHIVENP